MLQIGTGDLVRLTDIDNFDIVPLTLVRLGFPETDEVLITDAPYSVDYDGNTYQPGELRQVSPPKSEGTIDRDLFTISLDDPDSTYSGLLNNNNTGIDALVTLAFESTIDGVTRFLPLFSGQVTHYSVSQSGDTTVDQSVVVNCSGPLTKLYQISPRTTTPTSQDARPGGGDTDTCFAQAFRSNDVISLQWGGTGGE